MPINRTCGAVRAAILAILLAHQLPARAAEPAHVLATDWGLTLKSDGSGFYNDLAKLVLPFDHTEIEYEIKPYMRAKRAFLAAESSCLYPNSLDYLVSTGSIESADGFIASKSVIAAQSHVFAPHGSAPPTGPKDLAGKFITYALGSDVPNLLKGANARFVAVSDEVGKARMLLEGRTDLLIAVLPDAKFVFEHLGTDLPPYDPAYSLDSTDIGVICHQTPENITFIAAVNIHIARLLETGQLREFLISQGLNPDAHMPHHE
ncbi:MAG: hypothetical protein HWE25_06545 [Alphaproteobacteria bacterium]|nr:hypothetical protein [Alphaproteobacteria bacterium]